MTKQIINVGTAEQAGDGESIRSAFIKINDNFSETYNSIEDLNLLVDNLDISELSDTQGLLEQRPSNAWQSSQGKTFNTVEWIYGNEITITATPFETTTATTLDNRANSPYIYFAWNQNFINNVWESQTNEAGQNYSVSLDNGTTWIPVVAREYTTGTFFYFYIPDELQATYQFTYNAGQSVIIKYNRGSSHTLWFDLAEAPVPLSNIFAVDLTIVFEALVQGETYLRVKILRPNFRFANSAYADDGGTSEYIRVWSSAELVEDIAVLDSFTNNINQDFGGLSLTQLVEDIIIIDIRKNNNPADAGKVYASYKNSNTGSITFYWNAKLYTIN
jgi:hypothetical protein